MLEEELEIWFSGNGGRGAIVKHYEGHWEARVFDLDTTYIEGEGEGDTMLEALNEAIEDYQRSACGAI
jgi:hypothetical protein